MNISLKDETKVHYGIAKAHQMMLTVNSCIESADLTSLDYLLSWKESRSDITPDPTSGKALLLFVCLFQLEDNCFTKLFWFLLKNSMNQLSASVCPSL